jgi:osmotically-inducible protein OsmY/uncharacterized membrane protein YtjA (UPF0391 family)
MPNNRTWWTTLGNWSVLFLVIACFAALFGYTKLAGDIDAARDLFWAAAFLFLVTLAGSIFQLSGTTREHETPHSDSAIKRNVEAELEWDPVVDETDIAVAVKDGVVTLTGFVRNYAQRSQAESVAKRVAGVVGIANDLEVRLPSEGQRPDPEIARNAVTALKKELPNSYQDIKVIVVDGWVTLEGAVEWDYQRTRAKQAVERVDGVKGIISHISLKPVVGPAEIKNRIQEAFRRNAEVDAGSISVDADAGVVILKGKVRSWIEKEEAERTAWRAPGVTMVENRIEVRPY